MRKKFSLGLMSGTSADGLSVCAVQVRPRIKILHFKNYPYPKKLQQKVLQAYTLKTPQISELNFELGKIYLHTVQKFLREFSLSADDIEVIGSHGQTVYHGPHDKTPNTLQIGEPSFLAAQLHCPVVSDFRPKDMALGGQGAPLIPFFDEYMWGQSKRPVILLNIGGIANLSVVGRNIKTTGFDVGPGNTLLDLLCQEQFSKPFDQNGRLAAQGTPDKAYVNLLLKQPFFQKRPPKSLDKNQFGLTYLKTYFPRQKFKNPHDRLATAAWLSVAAVAQAVNHLKTSATKILVSGGGCYNQTLLNYLRELLPQLTVLPLSAVGIDPHAKESAAFALFAYLALHNKINHCARATGAVKNTILGKVTL